MRSPIHSMWAEQSYQSPVSESWRVRASSQPRMQRLVAGVDVDLVELEGALEVDAAGPHEPQGPLDLGGQLLVALALTAGGHELLHPRVDAGQVGEAALAEGPQQVQRGRRLVVRLHHALGLGHPGRGGGRGVVDDVAPEAGQLDVADALGGRRAGLGELAGDAADLHDGHAEGVGEHDRHLQDDLELLPDVHRRERLEALGAVARLQEEGPAVGHLAEGGGEVAGLAGEHERGIGGDLLEGALGGDLVGPRRLLRGGTVAPGRGRPGAHGAPAWPVPPTNATRFRAVPIPRCRRLARSGRRRGARHRRHDWGEP